MPQITPESLPSGSTFFTVPDTGLGQDPDTYVDKESRHLKAMGDFYADGTLPDRQINFMTTANSRNVGVNNLGGRAFSRAWSSGYERFFWSGLVGAGFTACDTTGRTVFGFSNASGVARSGSRVASPRDTVAGFRDLSRFGFGSVSAELHRGPGGGIAMDGPSNEFAIYQRNMDEDSLPSAMLDLFGSGGMYELNHTLQGDSQLLNSHEARIGIYYLKGPEFGTWEWEHRTSGSSTVLGTRNSEDPEGSVDSSTTTVMSHTFASEDSYNSTTRVMTFFQIAVAFSTDVEVGHAVHIRRAGNFSAIGIISQKTANSLTLQLDIDEDPQTGDILYFGPVELSKVTYIAPTTSAEYRGPLHRNISGTNLILGHDAIRSDGAVGFISSKHGWSGNGYRRHLENWPRESWFGELCSLAGVNAVLVHKAHQYSTEAYGVDNFPDEIVAVSPNIEIALCGDPQHSELSQASMRWEQAMLAQSDYAAFATMDSANIGNHWASWEDGQRDNESHPHVVGHSVAVMPILHMMSSLSAPSSSSSGSQGGIFSFGVFGGPVAG